LDGSNVRQVVVPKDPACGYTYFTFTNDAVVAIEPPLGTWDIVLTQYTHQFYVPFLPYIVSGVLTDPRHTRVARIPSADFDQVVLGDTLYHPFQLWRNVIGYDWKDYDFDIGAYTVFPQQVYLVEDTDGRHFKLHFLDFYDSLGQVGCPRFAFEEL
ncbi:MAG: HmuY family protein, partial [Flavobacteriales bacterium]|nr:HmuY family protein [Flavobacteriales bacterium]